MVKKSSVKKGNGLMYLSLGTLALFLTAYLVANTNFNQNVSAAGSEAMTGFLVSDSTYKYECNMETKSPYVLLESKSADSVCYPVEATRFQTSRYLGREVVVYGVWADGKFYAKRIVAKPTPIKTSRPYYPPDNLR